MYGQIKVFPLIIGAGQGNAISEAPLGIGVASIEAPSNFVVVAFEDPLDFKVRLGNPSIGVGSGNVGVGAQTSGALCVAPVGGNDVTCE